MFEFSTRLRLNYVFAFCIVILSSSTSILLAQQKYTIQELLQSAIRSNEEVNATNSDVNELNLPAKQWIDQMEFRTEFNELDLQKQEYTFRMRFRNDKVRKLQNKLFEMQLSYLENENSANTIDGAQMIYKNIVNWHFNQNIDSLASQKLNLIKDKNKLETTLFKNDQSLNFNDILKISEREKEIQLDLFDIRSEGQKILTSFAIVESDGMLVSPNLIEISKLLSTVEELTITENEHPTLSLHQSKMALLDQEYQIEENDKESLLKFAQLKYSDDNDLNLEREISVGIGLLIPYKTVDQAKVTEIELERIEENFKQQERVTEMQVDLEEEKLDLRNLIDKHIFLETLIKEENLALLKSEYLNSEQVTPMPLINLELMIIDRQLDLMYLKQEIYLQYIETLDSVDALRFSANTNYLDRNLAPIE